MMIREGDRVTQVDAEFGQRVEKFLRTTYACKGNISPGIRGLAG